MRNRQLVLCICLGLLLIGLAMAVDPSETYGAYPGAPSQVPTPTPAPSPVVGQATPGIYPAQTTTITATPTMPTIANPATMSSQNTAAAIYYTQAPPAGQQNVLLTYDVMTPPPAAIYYSGSYMPWTSFYQVFSANSPALWISSSVGWSWYATCPVGGWVQELMYFPVTGTMKLYDLYPDGTTKYYSYGFATPGYKYRWFHADAPGRYMTMLTIADIPSNYVIIDVA